ncbi:Trans-1,2-dihydrobenzene-1,2-diol dehydrogenase; AltName: Full=D-xylose 1-dehydrogenase; AltName: Full=D-xylose-NADP dehydrogenase; AltName: Full=Dimeric dihydrodiol dehydrogenase [Serendipita indica DSM 11827]|uniref:D-xylose 1-dehydrogenase (NADP(+), D-xylono-1,5-lactone-forming) n=1 Tax=Serendipita indica (strain DSM 11827) TaxID=1109443 RepID=G4TDY1_SERID|nr:Trans-1,2-dihydrobenzene-1,2-diol dehydrogenase; AltName: Full=D-xylose 1-dehydrogenase; AltName: Full=D-xylose-NADP dehydrogenase; AltName: Full=Dimeric dihydrodiol dehydrogenase [Serendipita indica DSM 11827]CCA69549.1 related to dimeric dihydrodiol dehydrogenase [Serendipita indica DSM 11827]
MADSVFTLRWAILGAGYISGKFVSDIILDPKTRGVTDVVHKLVAVGSRDAAKGKEFLAKITGKDDHPAKIYGSYEEVVKDPNVDAVYIGVPHPGHYDLTTLCLTNGKHVLCEKPFTVNAKEAEALIQLAKEKNLFLMEAMWTRFLPVADYISDLVKGGTLGDIRVLHADLSGDFDIQNLPLTHRILDPKLGGGALLDLGPYPLVWAIIAMYEHPANNKQHPSAISAAMLKTPLTGVDAHTSFTLNFDQLNAQAVLTCGITISSPNPALVIRLRKGNIIVDAPIYRPNVVKVQYLAKEGSDEVVKEETKTFKNGADEQHGGSGWHWQADEVARCIRDGKIQSDKWGWDKTLLEMKIFDEVRKQGQLVFPEGVEKLV